MTRNIDEFLANSTKEQKELLFNLTELAKREHSVREKINKITKCAKESGGYIEGGHSLVMCEDEEDVAILTYNDRKELKSIREEMKSYMLRAVDLKMADLGIIERTYETYVGKPLS